VADSEDALQIYVHELETITSKYALKMLKNKLKKMTFKGRDPVGGAIAIYNNITEQIETVNNLKIKRKYIRPTVKISKFLQITKIINRTLKPKTHCSENYVTFWLYLL
jgi:hypothetical protein